MPVGLMPAGPSPAGAAAEPGFLQGQVAAAGVAGAGIDRAPAAVDGPCGDFTRFVSSTMQAVASAILSVIPDIPFLKAAITWALTEGLKLGAEAAAKLLDLIPFIGAIRSAIGALALAVTVVASLRDWTVTVTADPVPAHYAVGASFSRLTVVGLVDDGPGDVFSPAVRACADLLGITLARGGAAGSAASWQIVAGGEHASPVLSQDTSVDPGRRTTYLLTMAREPEVNHERGAIANALVRARVTVKRQDVEQVRRFIEGAITGALPAPVWTALTGLFGDPVARIAAMTDVTAQGRAVVEYHLAPEPTPTPAESTSASPPPSVDPKQAFCDRYRALLTWWWYAPTEEPGTQPWAAEIVRRFGEMRPYAPADLRGAVDIHLGLYTATATYSGPELAVQAAPWAAQMPGAVSALDAYCGIRSGEFGRP
jgi:hypothetical protein